MSKSSLDYATMNQQIKLCQLLAEVLYHIISFSHYCSYSCIE